MPFLAQITSRKRSWTIEVIGINAILASDYFNHIYFCIHAFSFPYRLKWFFLKINIVKVPVAIHAFIFVYF